MLGTAGGDFTLFPNALLDHAMAGLNGAEFKVLAYIVRRTVGLGRETAAISLDQICHGVRNGDGTALDEGTGLVRKTAIIALRGLEQKGVIVVQRPPARMGNQPATFSVRRRAPADADAARTEGMA